MHVMYTAYHLACPVHARSPACTCTCTCQRRHNVTLNYRLIRHVMMRMLASILCMCVELQSLQQRLQCKRSLSCAASPHIFAVGNAKVCQVPNMTIAQQHRYSQLCHGFFFLSVPDRALHDKLCCCSRRAYLCEMCGLMQGYMLHSRRKRTHRTCKLGCSQLSDLSGVRCGVAARTQHCEPSSSCYYKLLQKTQHRRLLRPTLS
jgi:hypothetical protein